MRENIHLPNERVMSARAGAPRESDNHQTKEEATTTITRKGIAMVQWCREEESVSVAEEC